mmetsp:Transcript_168007/g.534439  ORF Transcript_168007/g.534439 Transcript_168007/m.534439 type:complete len:209 (+) Transcript_168007:581-1207(+)
MRGGAQRPVAPRAAGQAILVWAQAERLRQNNLCPDTKIQRCRRPRRRSGGAEGCTGRVTRANRLRNELNHALVRRIVRYVGACSRLPNLCSTGAGEKLLQRCFVDLVGLSIRWDQMCGAVDATAVSLRGGRRNHQPTQRRPSLVVYAPRANLFQHPREGKLTGLQAHNLCQFYDRFNQRVPAARLESPPLGVHTRRGQLVKVSAEEHL